MSRVEGVAKGARSIVPIGASLVLCAAAVAAAPLARPTSVTMHQTKRGKVLAAANGHSLYLYAVAGNNCYGACAQSWKPLLTSTRPVAASGSGVNAKLLGTTRRKDHTLQVTYNGHPLYTFTKDKTGGQITGEGAKQFNGRWYLVNGAGNAVKPKSGGRVICNPICQGY